MKKFQKRFSPKSVLCALIVLIAVITAACAQADAFTPSYTTYDTTYEKILALYLKIINGLGTQDYGRHDLFNPAVYAWIDPLKGNKEIISITKRDIGYMKLDINQDGVDELLIGADCNNINSIFTIDNGKVRELVRAGSYGTAASEYTCAMLVDGRLFRHGHGDAGQDYYEIWQMNGTGAVSFVEGYHTGAVRSSRPGSEHLAWFRSGGPMSKASGSQADTAVAEKWLKVNEENIFNKKFVSFSVLEKYPDDPWNIAVLSVKGTSSSAVKVNVRKEPSSTSKLVASKNVGTYVRVLSKEGDYFKIAFENKEGYIQQEYMTPLTYVIPEEYYPDASAGAETQEETTVQNDADESSDSQDPYPRNGKTVKAQVNVRKETDKKSRLVTTIQKKGSSVTVTGESAADDGMLWYSVTYSGKEGFIRSDFIELEEAGAGNTASGSELYGKVIKKLATRSGPSPRAEDTGTYNVKGQYLRVYSRVYDPIENAWWVKCDVPFHGEIRTLWAWYTRFDSSTLPLESIPIDEDY